MVYNTYSSCGNEVEVTQIVCPNCGSKIKPTKARKKMSPWRIVLCSVGAAFVVFAAVMLIINNSGASKSKPAADASNQAISAGTRAVNITDSYLDFKISAEFARSQTKALCDALKSSNDTSTVYYDLMSLDTSLLLADGLATSYDDVLAKRNNLAKSVGMEKRAK